MDGTELEIGLETGTGMSLSERHKWSFDQGYPADFAFMIIGVMDERELEHKVSVLSCSLDLVGGKLDMQEAICISLHMH